MFRPLYCDTRISKIISIRFFQGSSIPRSIRTNWATGKPAAPGSNSSNNDGHEFHGAPKNHHGGGGGGNHPGGKMLNYDDVFGQASSGNFTVYCGGISDSNEDTIRAAFSPYGRIMEILDRPR